MVGNRSVWYYGMSQRNEEWNASGEEITDSGRYSYGIHTVSHGSFMDTAASGRWTPQATDQADIVDGILYSTEPYQLHSRSLRSTPSRYEWYIHMVLT